MLKRSIAWIEAAWIFALSRLIILIITIITAIRLPLAGQGAARTCAFDSACFLSWWFHWDVLSYIGVADRGYSLAQNTVFFPLWPLLIRLGGALSGGSIMSYYVAGLVLANLFFFLALVVLYRLLSEDFEPGVAKSALFYLAFYPYAVFFFVGYTESLFLLLSLAVFFFLQRSNYWLAGLCGFLAALTRAAGVLLVIPFLIVLLQRFWMHASDEQTTWQEKLRASFPGVLIPLGLVAFMLYLGVTKGNPIVFSTEEAGYWHRHLTFPLVSLFVAFKTFFRPETPGLHILNGLDLAFTLLPLAILALGWKRLPLHYSLFALAAAIFDLSYPQGGVEPLAAAPRYFMVIFPILVILALWGKRQRLDRVILAISLPIFALNVALFVSHYWVA